MTASEFNKKYKGFFVKIQDKHGVTHSTSDNENQAWRNHKNEVLINVFGRNSAMKLSDVKIISIFK